MYKGRPNKIKKIYEEKDGKIIFDKGFFERLFIKNPISTNKQLTSLSIRLASVLLEELSMLEYRKLPSRTKLAKKLNVSNTAVNDSLIQLEEVGLLERRISEIEAVVFADQEEDNKIKKEFNEKKVIERNSRRFSDYFRINYNYNLTKEDLIEESLKDLKEILLNNNMQSEVTAEIKKQIQQLLQDI